jgi:hypothetical protein
MEKFINQNIHNDNLKCFSILKPNKKYRITLVESQETIRIQDGSWPVN